jgi:hypothetical protein
MVVTSVEEVSATLGINKPLVSPPVLAFPFPTSNSALLFGGVPVVFIPTF